MAPELIPANGAWDIVNGLLNEENVLYRRGGAKWASADTGNTFVDGKGQMLWSGFLKHGGHQTLLYVEGAGPGYTKKLYKVKANGELEEITITLPAGRLAPCVFQGVLYFPTGEWFDGESKGKLEPGKAWYATAGNRLLRATGDRIEVSNVPKVEGETPKFETEIVEPNITTTENSAKATVSSATGIVAGMPIMSGLAGINQGTTVVEVKGTELILSAPASRTAEAVKCFIGEANYLVIPEGVEIVGMEGFRSSCIVFTTQGIWLIQNLEKNITDVNGNSQWVQDRYSADASLWGYPGVAAWKGGVVIPCKDDVWLMELGVSSEKSVAFKRISAPIQNVYRKYVNEGCVPGTAVVYKGHYLLPIVNPSLDRGGVVTVLVCRLEPVAAKAGPAWTRLAGTGGTVSAYALPAGEAEGGLLGVGFTPVGGDPRVMSCYYFEPGEHPVTQESGAVVEGDPYLPKTLESEPEPTSDIVFGVVTRAVPTGNLVPNLVAKIRARYELVGGESPTVKLFTTNTYPGPWGELFPRESPPSSGGKEVALVEETNAIPTPGADPEATKPVTWRISRKVRYLSLRVQLESECMSFSLRTLEIFVRADGRVI